MTNATIFNNQFTQSESALRIDNPYMCVRYPDKDKAIAGGKMYFGASFLDGFNPANRRRVYVIQEDSSAIPIEQPVYLSDGGIPLYNGQPAKLAIDGSYSWTVHDKNDNQILYSANTTHPSISNLGAMTIKENSVELTTGQSSVSFPDIDVFISTISATGPLIDSRPLFRDTDFTVSSGDTGTIFLTSTFPAGTTIVARQNAFTGEDTDTVTGFVYQFKTLSSAIVADMPIDSMVMIAGASSYNDGLTFDKYIVVAGGTGTNDNVDFINMTNGNQLQSLQTRSKLKTYTESVALATLTGGVVTMDVNKGTVFTLTQNQSISSFTFTNVQAGVATSIALYITQDGTGGWSASFSGLLTPGGVAPTLTTTAGTVVKLFFSTRNGLDWEVYAADDLQVV